MKLSSQEMIDMIYVLGASDQNCLLATRIYQEKFPDRRQPTRNSFQLVKDRFDSTGCVSYQKKERQKTVVNENNELNVILSVTEDPHVSSRSLSRHLELGRTSIQTILRKNKMHPYHCQLLQELDVNDYQRRLSFCQWTQEKIVEDASFVQDVLFCDEATFHKNGNVNRHNFHYYAVDNPHFVHTHSQNRWSLNVWAGILGDHVTGPHFFNGRVNGQVYLDFIQNDLPILLEDIPLNIRNKMWLLHDGAPVHNTEPIRNYLNYRFPHRWIGRGGPVPWPARSPDLTKMDFFLWGYVKEIVYREPPTDAENMKERIRNVLRNVDVNMLRRTTQSFEKRLQLCIDANGRHFEHLL